MQIDRRITNGLAWAGAFLVVGVPAADLVSAQLAPAPSAQVAVVETPVPAPLSQRPAAKPAETVAAVAPAPVVSKPEPQAAKPVVEQVAATPAPEPAAAPVKPAPVQTASAYDAFVQSGKPVPSYINDGTKPASVGVSPQQSGVTPVRPATQQAAVAPVQSAAQAQAPVEEPGVDPIEVAALPAKVAPTPMPLSMRPAPIQVPIAAAALPSRNDVIIPPADVTRPSGEVFASDLEDWESGPLSEFLQQREARSSATVVYEDEGFFLDSVRPRDRYIGPADSFFAPPGY